MSAGEQAPQDSPRPDEPLVLPPRREVSPNVPTDGAGNPWVPWERLPAGEQTIGNNDAVNELDRILVEKGLPSTRVQFGYEGDRPAGYLQTYDQLSDSYESWRLSIDDNEDLKEGPSHGEVLKETHDQDLALIRARRGAFDNVTYETVSGRHIPGSEGPRDSERPANARSRHGVMIQPAGPDPDYQERLVTEASQKAAEGVKNTKVIRGVKSGTLAVKSAFKSALPKSSGKSKGRKL